MAKSCVQECLNEGLSCNKKDCRHYINYDGDYNCSIISADAHGPMTLEDVADRVGLSLVRVKQIEEAALVKLKKRMGPSFV